MPFFFDAAILSRIRSPVTSRSNWAKDRSTLSVKRPMELVVLNCWVTETKIDVVVVYKVDPLACRLCQDRGDIRCPRGVVTFAAQRMTLSSACAALGSWHS